MGLTMGYRGPWFDINYYLYRLMRGAWLMNRQAHKVADVAKILATITNHRHTLIHVEHTDSCCCG